MAVQISAAHEFRQRRLRQLVRVQVSGLLHDAQALDHIFWTHAPAHAQAGERHFRKAVDLNHHAMAVEGLQRRNRIAAHAEPGVNAIFDYWNLIARDDFQELAALGYRYARACGILEVGSEKNQLHAVLRQQRFHRAYIEARITKFLRGGLDWHSDAAHPGPCENRNRAGITRILHQHRIARAQKRLAEQVERLLAAVGDQKLLVACCDALFAQHLEQNFL